MVQERRQVREEAEAVCDLFMSVCAAVYIQIHYSLVCIAIASSAGTTRKVIEGVFYGVL